VIHYVDVVRPTDCIEVYLFGLAAQSAEGSKG